MTMAEIWADHGIRTLAPAGRVGFKVSRLAAVLLAPFADFWHILRAIFSL